MSKRTECRICELWAAYYDKETANGEDGREAAMLYREGPCQGHTEYPWAIHNYVYGESTRSFLLREPKNSAEEYAQAVGWQLLKAV